MVYFRMVGPAHTPLNIDIQMLDAVEMILEYGDNIDAASYVSNLTYYFFLIIIQSNRFIVFR